MSVQTKEPKKEPRQMKLPEARYKEKRRRHRLEERRACGRRLGIRRGASRSGHGFLGARTVKPPTPNLKPGMTTHSVRPGVARQPTAEERRRSQRVLVRMPVIIHVAGTVLPGNTHTVSAGGAMVILKEG